MPNPFDQFDSGNPFDRFEQPEPQPVPKITPPPEKKPLEQPAWLAAVDKFFGLEERPEPNLVPEALQQGITFGFSDETAGAGAWTGAYLKALTDGKGTKRASDAANEAYERATGEKRKELAEFRKEHPYASFGLEAAGGFVSAGPAAAKLITNPSLWSTSLRSGATGATVGGLYGAGSAEGGLAERAAGAGKGAALGGFFGLATPGGIEIGKRVLSPLFNRFRSAPKLAGQRFARALERDQMTPQQLESRMRELGPRATPADAGGANVRGLARAAAGVPGKAKERAATVLNTRQEGQVGRVAGEIDNQLHPEDFYSAQDEFLKNLRENAAPVYEEAYRAGKKLVSDKIEKLLARPVAKRAMREAAKIAQVEGRRVAPLNPELTQRAKEAVARGDMPAKAVPKGGIGEGITTEALDDLKRGLDAMIEKETNQLTGRMNKMGRALTIYKNEILKEADALNPLYREARRIYGGDAEVLSALREGRDALRMDPEQISRHLETLSDAAKKAFRSGAARAIKDVIEKTPDGSNAVRRIFGNELVRKKLRAIFPSREAYSNFERAMEREATFFETRADVLQGSRTTPMAEEIRDMSGDTVVPVIQAMRGSPTSLIDRTVGGLIRKLQTPSERIANELSGTLMSQNPQAMSRALRGAYSTPQPQLREQQIRAALAASLAGPISARQR